MSGRVGKPVQAPKPHDQGVPPFGVQAVFFRGTLAPFFRASESPIAIACLRLLTVPPFPPLPQRRVPLFFLRMALATVLLAALPYFRLDFLPELDLFLVAIKFSRCFRVRFPIGGCVKGAGKVQASSSP